MEASLWIILSLSNKHTTLYRKLTNLDNTNTSENVDKNENGCQYLKQTNLARDKRDCCVSMKRETAVRVEWGNAIWHM